MGPTCCMDSFEGFGSRFEHLTNGLVCQYCLAIIVNVVRDWNDIQALLLAPGEYRMMLVFIVVSQRGLHAEHLVFSLLIEGIHLIHQLHVIIVCLTI